MLTKLLGSGNSLSYEAALRCLSWDEQENHKRVMHRVNIFDRHSSTWIKILQKYCAQEKYSDLVDVKNAQRRILDTERFLEKYLGAVSEVKKYSGSEWFKPYRRTLVRASIVEDLLSSAKKVADHVGLRIAAYEVVHVSESKDHPDFQLEYMIERLNPRVELLKSEINDYDWEQQGFFNRLKMVRQLERFSKSARLLTKEYENIGAQSYPSLVACTDFLLEIF